MFRQQMLTSNKVNAWSLTPWATKTSWMQQIPTTVIPCSLHNVAAATRTTVRAMGAHTAKKERKFFHVFYATLIYTPLSLRCDQRISKRSGRCGREDEAEQLHLLQR